ncbi:MAG: N-acetylmuramoyl-L-alanine amidase [Bacteroidales bacterium]|nr:N-acetylmuramoyl-L-alanine amidase [Bacteroidales bacterium]
MRTITQIVIHCSSTQEGADFQSEDIKRWHKQRGFRDVGYHYVITLNGDIQVGRPIEEIGAHVKGHNSHSIGVCYIGGLDDKLKSKDTRTLLQKVGLQILLVVLKEKFPDANILGHRDFENVKKACPCFNVKSEYKKL